MRHNGPPCIAHVHKSLATGPVSVFVSFVASPLLRFSQEFGEIQRILQGRHVDSGLHIAETKA